MAVDYFPASVYDTVLLSSQEISPYDPISIDMFEVSFVPYINLTNAPKNTLIFSLSL
jgi:hypothetical protein